MLLIARPFNPLSGVLCLAAFTTLAHGQIAHPQISQPQISHAQIAQPQISQPQIAIVDEPQPAAASTPVAAAAADQLPTLKFTLHAAKLPPAALKYRLLPKYLDKQPGNAAVQYMKAVLPDSGLQSANSKPIEQMNELLSQPLEKFDVVAARKLLDSMAGSIYRMAKLGAHRRDCEWDLPIREETYIEILLPDVQAMRQLGHYLAFRARVQIAEGKIDEALETLQVGMALASDVARGPTLIHGLVGVATASTMVHQLRALVQSPECPNLYWALASLPRPFIDFRTAMEMESDGVFLMFPQLKDVDKQHLTSEQWNAKLAELSTSLAGLTPLLKIGNESLSIEQLQATVGLTALTALKYPRAKSDLVAAGWPQERLDAMPIAQVLLLHIGSTFETLRDDSFKWFYVPYWQAIDSSISAERSFVEESKLREIVPLAGLLVPAVNSARFATVRLDRELAALTAVEAIRLHASQSAGKLPAQLSEVTTVPIPLDPVTGKSFDYELKGDVAILTGPPPRGRHANQAGVRYELTMAKLQPKKADDKPIAKTDKTDRDPKQPATDTAPPVKNVQPAPLAKRPAGGLFRNPITQARESARRSQSMNNLKQLSLAMHMYADTNKRFPPARSVDKQGKPLLSWRVQLLPYIEQQALFDQFKHDEPWDSDHNKKLIDKMPKLFENPIATPLEAGKTAYVVVRGKETIFHDEKGTPFKDITDGTSQTMMIVEAGPDSAVVWTKPDDVEFNEKDPLAALLGLREGGFLAAFADGSVRFVSDTISKEDIAAMLTRAGGEVIKQ